MKWPAQGAMTKSKKKESRRRKALREQEEGKAQDEKESFHPPLRANYMDDPALCVRELEDPALSILKKKTSPSRTQEEDTTRLSSLIK